MVNYPIHVLYMYRVHSIICYVKLIVKPAPVLFSYTLSLLIGIYQHSLFILGMIV